MKFSGARFRQALQSPPNKICCRKPTQGTRLAQPKKATFLAQNSGLALGSFSS